LKYGQEGKFMQEFNDILQKLKDNFEQEIRLSRDWFSLIDPTQLAGALKNNTTLTHIDLSGQS
jgi:hypothetical protein